MNTENSELQSTVEATAQVDLAKSVPAIEEQRELPLHIKKMILRDILKDVKKRLPSACTFLTSIKRASGEIHIRAIINKDTYTLRTPDNLNFTDAHIKEVYSSLLEKCQ